MTKGKPTEKKPYSPVFKPGQGFRHATWYEQNISGEWVRPYVEFCYENRDQDLDGFKLEDLGDIRAPEHNFVAEDMTKLEKHWKRHSQSGSKHPLAWTIWDTYKGLMIINFLKHVIPRFFMQQFVE